SDRQEKLFAANPRVKDEYVLNYMLGAESRGSLLSVERFSDPWRYELKVTRANETATLAVDVVETFTYLMGLRVHHSHAARSVAAVFERSKHGRLVVSAAGVVDAPDGTYRIKLVEGRDENGAPVLAVWRCLTNDPERDGAVLLRVLQDHLKTMPP